MNSLGVVDEKLLAMAIIASQDWAHTGRVMNVRLSKALTDVQGLPALAERGIESIRSASESPLNALQTGREKKRQEAFESIRDAVATPCVHADVEEWKMSLVVRLVKEMNFFNSIKFSINHCGELTDILVLDGWSGNILNGYGEAQCFCMQLDTARIELGKAFMYYLENETAGPVAAVA